MYNMYITINITSTTINVTDFHMI